MLLEAADRLNLTCDGWRHAFQKVRLLRTVKPAIKQSFLTIWIESKHLALTAGDHRAVADALHVLMPRYEGCTVRLFRGASAHERRRRIYGLSWSGDADVADRFARDWQRLDEGGVLLETLAPPNAVISAPGGHYHEREYLVDRRHLRGVKVVRKYLGPAVKSAGRREKGTAAVPSRPWKPE